MGSDGPRHPLSTKLRLGAENRASRPRRATRSGWAGRIVAKSDNGGSWTDGVAVYLRGMESGPVAIRRRLVLAGIATLLWANVATAQQGDRAGEEQTLLPDTVVVPPAIVRSPAEELATFRIAPGFAIEAVATEPLIEDPVAAMFDADGRMWVIEMRAYMRDVDAGGEREPFGRIRILRDVDGDGRMDEAKTFLDGLVLPRAVLPLVGGALVVEPPNLLWCPDADGDGVADGKVVVTGGFEAGLDNPEHSGNGLLWAFDHRIHLANDKRVLRRSKDGFVVEQGSGGGQWGLAQDDRGRLYFNYNEDWLRCDLVPGTWATRVGAGALAQLNHRVLQDRSVWPIRITPGVNRGYQPGRLVDYVLAIHTAVCSPYIYRDDLLPARGDVFVCEPAGNVVRRIALRDVDGVMAGDNVYQADKREFLASTDERFRPVHIFGGPDRALYVVDMYRGVIQHRNFVTTFLRDQIKKRGLEQPTGLGRIWRIVPTAAVAPVAQPPLGGASVEVLLAALGGNSSVRRDLAMRELVQRELVAAAPGLRSLARNHADAAVRTQALATLAGLGGLSRDDVRTGVQDGDPGVAAMALQYAAAHLAAGDGFLWQFVQRAALQGPPTLAWHGALAFAETAKLATDAKVQARVQAAAVELLAKRGNEAMVADTLAAGLGLQAVAVLALGGDSFDGKVVRALGAAVGKRRASKELDLFFPAVLSLGDAAKQQALAGFVGALPKAAARAGCLKFAATPPALAALGQGRGKVADLAHEILAAVALQPAESVAAAVARSPDELRRLGAGERLFAAACAACHQLDGAGMAGLAPPLLDSEWVAGPVDRPIRIVLHGVKGPIEAAGQQWDREMPGQGHLGDQELADILSYVRTRFGRVQQLVGKEDVSALRKAHAARKEPWTATELLR